MKKQTPVLNTVLLVLTVVGMLAMIEATLRVYFWGTLAQPFSSAPVTIPHPTRTIAYGPNLIGAHQELDFNVPIFINEQGLRGSNIGQKDHRQRILLVADSTTFGSGVAVEHIMPTLLVDELGAEHVEIINGGFATYNTVQELLFLEEEGLTYNPDLVILAFSPNTDIQTNTLRLQRLHQRKARRAYALLHESGELELDLSYAKAFYEKEKDRSLDDRRKSYYKRHATYRLGKMLVNSFKTSKFHDPNIFIGWPFLAEFAPEYSTRDMTADEYEQIWNDGWAVTRALILRMRDETLANGARFAMMVMAPKLQVEVDYQEKVLETYPNLRLDLTRINRVVDEFGRQTGIPVLDARSVLVEAARAGQSGLYYHIEDEHMTAKSHQLLAQSLAQQLQELELVNIH